MRGTAWLFVGSDRGGERAAIVYSLIAIAKLNDVDPQGVARRRARPHRRPSDPTPRRAAALAPQSPRRSRLMTRATPRAHRR